MGSVSIMRDEAGNSKGFGFVCYEKPEDANKALEQEHGRVLGDKTLYVAKAEKKADRQKALEKSTAKVNVYIRNFDKQVTEGDLKSFFNEFGEVRNVKIMVTTLPNGQVESKGFGFVCFKQPEHAQKVVELAGNNQLILQGKQIFAAFFENKQTRKQKFEKETNQFGPQIPGTNQTMNQQAFLQIFQKFATKYQNRFNNMGGRPFRGRGRGRGGFHRGGMPGGFGPPQMPQHPMGFDQFPGKMGFDGPMGGMPMKTPPPMSGGPPPPMAGGPPPMRPPTMANGPPPPMKPPSGDSGFEKKIAGVLESSSYKSMSEEDKREKIGETIYLDVQ